MDASRAKSRFAWSDPPERGRRVLELGLCSFLLAWLYADALRQNGFATDFRYAFWPAARHILHGISPYPTTFDFGQLPFVYPMPAGVLLAPFGLLPEVAAGIVFTLLAGAAVVIALRLCGVQDWRCYGIAFLWAPVFSALQTANITLLLAVGLALLWRIRDHRLAAPGVAGILVAAKIFLWPVLIWLLVRRGIKTAAGSALFAAGITLASWSVIGFSGLADYPHLVRLIEQVEGSRSYSLFALGLKLGLPHSGAIAVALLAGSLVLGAAVAVGNRTDGERRAFALTIVAMLLFSPVVWLHYFALLLVSLALLRPRFGPLWLLPLLLWPCPTMIESRTWWPLAPLLVFGVMLTVAVGQVRQVKSRRIAAAEATP